jgi:hypothetical protein
VASAGRCDLAAKRHHDGLAIMTVLLHRKHGLARADPEGSGHEFAAVAATAGTGTGATLPACPSAVRYISPGPSQSYQVRYPIAKARGL